MTLARQTLLYLPSQIMAPAIQFLMIVVWAHFLAPTELGIITLTIAAQELTHALLASWWSTYMLRSIHDVRKAGQGAAFEQFEALILFVIVALIGIVSGLFSQFYISTNLSPVQSTLIIMLMASRSLVMYSAERSRVDADIVSYSIVQFYIPFASLLLVYGALAIGDAGLTAVLCVMVVANLSSFVATAVRRGLKLHRPRWHRQQLTQGWSYGGPAMLAAILSAVLLNAPRFIVESQQGLEAGGVFNVAYGLGLRIASVAVMLVTAGAYPLAVKTLADKGLNAAYDQLWQNFLLVMGILLPTGAGALLVSGALAEILIPSSMHAVAVTILPLSICFGVARYLRAHTVDQIFYLRKRPKIVAAIVGAEIVPSVICFYMCVMYYNASIAIAALICFSAISLIISAWLSYTLLGFKYPVGDLLKVTLACALMYVAVSWWKSGTGWFDLMAQVLVGGACYSLTMSFLYRKQVVARLSHHLRPRLVAWRNS